MIIEHLFEEYTEIEAKRRVSYTKKVSRQHEVNTAKPNNVPSATKEKLTLPTLPLDVLHCIFDRLDPATSTCLGLSCKALYPVHRGIHGTVDLTTPVLDSGKILADLIGDFFVDPWFSFEVRKFVPVVRFFEINSRRLRVGIERTRELLEREDEEMVL